MRRKAAHAGSWYTADATTLSRQLDDWLARVPESVSDESGCTVTIGSPRFRAIIGPHAGYAYSGATAAYAYKALATRDIKRVFILGPSHHVYVGGCALTACSTYETPLGDLVVDKEVSTALAATPGGLFRRQMSLDEDEQEHSLEMHLPFVRRMLDRAGNSDARIVPILVGALSWSQEKAAGAALAPFLRDESNAFVVSTDFCHWGARFDYTVRPTRDAPIWQGIEALDREGMALLEAGDAAGFAAYLDRTQNTICGRHPVMVLLCALEGFPLPRSGRIHCLAYAQSSRCVRANDSSVSYVAAAASLE